MPKRKYVQLSLFDESVILDENVVCRICGKPLKNPLSKLKGVGPVCERKLR